MDSASVTMKKLTSENSRQNSCDTWISHPACRKRLRFCDMETVDYLSRGNDDSAYERQIPSAKSSEAKTSEYAYFKKLKMDASQGCDPRSDRCSGSQVKEIESDDFVKANFSNVNTGDGGKAKSSNAITKDVWKDLNSSSFVYLETFSSPSNFELENSEVELSELTNVCKIPWNKFSSISENTETRGDSFKSMVDISGSYEHEGVFFDKRKKLNQWGTDVSIPGIEEFHLKSGLFLDKENDEQFSKRLEADTKSVSIALPELDIHLREPYQRLLELNDVQYSDHRFSNFLYNEAINRMSSGTESMTCHSVEPNVQYSLTEPDCGFGGSCPTTSSGISTFHFPGKGHENASDHVNELDEYCDLNAYQLEREPNILLPGWDHTSMENGQYFSIPPTLSLLESSRANFFQDGLENAFGATKFCMSSFLLSSPSNSTYSVHTYLANHDVYDPERIGDQKSVAVVSNHFPHSLLQDQSCLSLSAECDFNDEFKSRHILVSPENCTWFMNKVFSETSAIQSSGIGIELGWKCQSLAGSSKVYESPTSSTIPSLHSSLFLAQDEHAGYMNSSVSEETENHFVLGSVYPPKYQESSSF